MVDHEHIGDSIDSDALVLRAHLTAEHQAKAIEAWELDTLRSLHDGYHEAAKPRGFRFPVGPTVAGMDCGCGACPDCRPGVAEVAFIIEKPFATVLNLVQRAEDAMLIRTVEMLGPTPTRPQARRQARARAKAAHAAQTKAKGTP